MASPGDKGPYKVCLELQNPCLSNHTHEPRRCQGRDNSTSPRVASHTPRKRAPWLSQGLCSGPSDSIILIRQSGAALASGPGPFKPSRGTRDCSTRRCSSRRPAPSDELLAPSHVPWGCSLGVVAPSAATVKKTYFVPFPYLCDIARRKIPND